MADRHQFSEDFLRKLEGRDFDVRDLEDLVNLTPDQRSQLTGILIDRKSKRAATN